jgi:hypothetical protein
MHSSTNKHEFKGSAPEGLHSQEKEPGPIVLIRVHWCPLVVSRLFEQAVMGTSARFNNRCRPLDDPPQARRRSEADGRFEFC